MSLDLAIADVVIPVVSIAVSALVAVLISRAERRVAERAAEEASAAADRAAEEQGRIAAAVEVLAERQPRWEITWKKGSTFLLTNVGDNAAENVSLIAGGSVVKLSAKGPLDLIAPNAGRLFLAASGWGANEFTADITVTWSMRGGDHRFEWASDLPAEN